MAINLEKKASTKAKEIAPANEQVKNQVAEAKEVETKQEPSAALQEAEKLAEEAKELQRKAKEAAAAAKEALKKAKAANARPIRLNRFVAINKATGESVEKGDVHYCVEKAAIDYVAERRESSQECEIEIYKENKKSNDLVLVSRVYLDIATSQVVID